jgi:3-deoxy-D-manno-octulosonate 8-phosphate phosphatase (KDO 8-P phosphatase)
MNIPLIKAVALDVDGVLTDGTYWWGPGGEEWKRFSFRDGMGVVRGGWAGLIFALISGEDTPLIDRYAAKMGITDVYKGCKDKAGALRAFSKARGLDLSDICFMGDDINDLEAMELAGLAAAPADAHESVRRLAAIVTSKPGGGGAVRELLDLLMARLRGNELKLPKKEGLG